MAHQTAREAIGVFSSAPALQSAVDDLLVSGFDRSFLSVLAAHHVVERRLGRSYDKVGDIACDPGAPHAAFVGVHSRTEAKAAATAGLAYLGAAAAAGAVVASGGTLALIIAAAATAGGTGGALGTVVARYIGARHRRHTQHQLERGGLLLWVRTMSEECERRACEILGRNGASGVHVHDIPAHPTKRAGGISGDFAWINKPLPNPFSRRRWTVAPARPRPPIALPTPAAPAPEPAVAREGTASLSADAAVARS